MAVLLADRRSAEFQSSLELSPECDAPDPVHLRMSH